jgi:hypothetical protein
VTVVPTGPAVGENEVIVGAAPAHSDALWELRLPPAGKFTTDTLLQVTFGVLRLTNHAGVSLTKDISVELAPGLGMSGRSG